MPSPPSTRPNDARGRRSSAFIREDTGSEAEEAAAELRIGYQGHERRRQQPDLARCEQRLQEWPFVVVVLPEQTVHQLLAFHRRTDVVVRRQFHELPRQI